MRVGHVAVGNVAVGNVGEGRCSHVHTYLYVKLNKSGKLYTKLAKNQDFAAHFFTQPNVLT